MSESLPSFTQPIGLLPLPNVVLLPGGTLPLQIHERRYRAMVRDALQADSYLAMALLRPGWEPYYYTNQAKIYPILCVGHIREHVKTPEGRYFLNLVGLCRARTIEEDRSGEYRRATIEPMLPAGPAVHTDGEHAARTLLQKLASSPAFDDLRHIEDCRNLADGDGPLSDLVDRLAADILPAEAVEIRQHILEEMDALRRAGTLLAELRILSEKQSLRRQRDEHGRPPHSSN